MNAALNEDQKRIPTVVKLVALMAVILTLVLPLMASTGNPPNGGQQETPTTRREKHDVRVAAERLKAAETVLGNPGPVGDRNAVP